jgi:hypothetical protein
MAQVVECLLSQQQDLNSNPTTCQKKLQDLLMMWLAIICSFSSLNGTLWYWWLPIYLAIPLLIDICITCKFLAFTKGAALEVFVYIIKKQMHTSLLNIYLKVAVFSHRAYICSTLINTASFPRCWDEFILIGNVCDFWLLHSLIHIYIYTGDASHSDRWVFHWGLNFIFLMNNSIEYIFILCWLFMSPPFLPW